MRLTGFGLLASILLIDPAWAGSWSNYYNMATFVAGGGTDEGGWFNFECADEESGFSMAGQPFFDVTIGENFHQKKQRWSRRLPSLLTMAKAICCP